MTISVIVPVYNVENYLDKCLTTILSQTYSDLEVICVNDGSTDNSLKMLKEFQKADKRVKVIDQKNAGLSAARNVGLTHATGEYVSFIDSDDFLQLNFYEELVKTAKANNADVVVAGMTKYIEVNEKDFRLEPYLTYKKEQCVEGNDKKYELADLPDHCYVMNKLYSRHLLLRSKVTFEEGVYYEDIEWTHKILYFSRRLAVAPNTTYFYRQRGTSIVANFSMKHMIDFHHVCKSTIDFVQSISANVGNMEKYKWFELTEYILFGITLLTVRTCGRYKLYYLLGKWLIFEIRTKSKQPILDMWKDK